MTEPAPESAVPSQKDALRATMRLRLDGMTTTERRDASRHACIRLMGLDVFAHASVVMLYMPIAAEVDTTMLAIRCFQAGKTICVPRVDWARRDMSAVEVNSFDDHFMDTDEHGIRTPRNGRPIVRSSIDLVVVPALAYDTHGNRLGRGGGYYDRFLSRLRRSASTVGLAFDTQIAEHVPADENDVRVDYVVTDRRVNGSRRTRTR